MSKLVSAWRKCKGLCEQLDAKRIKLQDDPLKIPEVPVTQYLEYRAQFVARHRDVMLCDYKEPHKRFVERLLRDLCVHELVLPYKRGEIRLKCEDVVQKPGLTASADLLVQISREEVPTAVTSDEDAWNRIHVFFVALEYVGILTYARASDTGDLHGRELGLHVRT